MPCELFILHDETNLNTTSLARGTGAPLFITISLVVFVTQRIMLCRNQMMDYLHAVPLSRSPLSLYSMISLPPHLPFQYQLHENASQVPRPARSLLGKLSTCFLVGSSFKVSTESLVAVSFKRKNNSCWAALKSRRDIFQLQPRRPDLHVGNGP